MKNEFFLKFTTLQVALLEPHILQVKLSRPELHNAINASMWHELKELWQHLYVDSGNIRCLILTGAGNKAFSAGADLKERNGLDTKTWLKQHSVLEQSMRAMMDCPLPIIAAINGLAYGGGLELVLACDFAYSVESAKFAFPEPKIGIIPGALGTQLLPRVCGIKIAKEICIGGKVLDAIEAKKYGLINKILPNHDELWMETLQ
jgi:enoyl-CoA hydratase